MKALIQRVNYASVTVEGKIIGKIGKGILIFFGVGKEDTEKELNWIGEKVLRLRLFEDENGKMNKSIKDVNGDILIVSQFTLYGDCKKGTRPSFTEAAGAEKGRECYEKFLCYLKHNFEGKVESGEFGADMKVELLNDGPVTLMVEK
jgi:D-tyrosyl-tRNA(Tyr) deacylase